jgi:hypothetical protein
MHRELAQNVVDVVLHRRDFDIQAPGDLLVGKCLA